MQAGDSARERMKEAGVTQTEVADKLGVTRAYVSMQLNGHCPMKLETRKAIAECINEVTWRHIRAGHAATIKLLEESGQVRPEDSDYE